LSRTGLIAAGWACVLLVAAGSGEAARARTGTSAPAGTFVSNCAYSHRGWSDPIVFPRLPFSSHNHTFVGNVTTNAFSTLSSLRAGGTSCDLRADTSAYWAPTLMQDGKPVLPRRATIYYRRLTTVPVRPFPAGLRMIAGNSRARLPQSIHVTYWNCSVNKASFYGINRRAGVTASSNEVGAASSSVPECPATAALNLHVNFPDCWNGKTLDSPDHKSHMAYSVAGKCPAGYPVAVPALTLVYLYPPVDPHAVILSSGGQHSGHADFMNAWNQKALTKLVDTCLNHDTGCGIAGALAPDTA
jgi:hypothetical protein